MQNVTFLLFPNIMASSISLPVEMLNAADNIRRTEGRISKKLTVNMAAQNLNPILTSGGLSVVPNSLLSDIDKTDLIIIPALWRNPLTTLEQNSAICEWLIKNNHPDTQICAVGTGSSFLAKAKILDHKPATTHWFYYDLMRNKFPNVEWKRQHLITQADNIFCAGSVNSIADLTIHLIENSFSKSIARKVESQFSPEIRKSYDAHLFNSNPETSHHDELVANSQDYIRQNFHEHLNLENIAVNSGIAHRSFQRRFKQATGFSPLQYQQYIRVQNGKELLQNTNLNIQEVSELIGYIDASHFSKVFKKHTEQTPKSYRNSVRGKIFTSKS